MGRRKKGEKEADQKLVADWLQWQDDESWDPLMDRLGGIVSAAARKWQHIHGMTEDDVAQELWANMPRTLRAWSRSRGCLVAWVKFACQRHCITLYKQSQLRRDDPLNQAKSMDTSDPDMTLDLYAPQSAPMPDDFSLPAGKLEAKLSPLEAKVWKAWRAWWDGNDLPMSAGAWKFVAKECRIRQKKLDNCLERIKHKARKVLEDANKAENLLDESPPSPAHGRFRRRRKPQPGDLCQVGRATLRRTGQRGIWTEYVNLGNGAIGRSLDWPPRQG